MGTGGITKGSAGTFLFFLGVNSLGILYIQVEKGFFFFFKQTKKFYFFLFFPSGGRVHGYFLRKKK